MLMLFKNDRASRWVRVGVWMSLVLVVGVPRARGQQSEATFGGRPFVRIARANTTDAGLGFIQGFGRSQFIGDEVVMPILGPGFEAVGLARGRGGPLTVVARAGTPEPAGGSLARFHDGLARETSGNGVAPFVFAAGVSLADGLYLAESGGFRSLLASGSVLPNSNGRVANRLGEPHWMEGRLAVIAWHQGAAGVEFRGVYRVVDGALEAIADTATALPGAVGVPDTFSSQVGFDGNTVAFWATRGPFAEVQGIFRSGGGAVVAVASTGDPLPGGGTIGGFRSPPSVEDGVVWFFAHDAARTGYLLRGAVDGSITVVARDGDAAPEGGVLAGIGDTGLEVSGGRVLFGARTGAGPGVYSVEGGVLRAVVPGGGIVAGGRPTSVALMDLEGDTLVLLTTGPGVQPAAIVANLARPAVPVVLEPLQAAVVGAGARIELKVAAAGDPPLSFLWWGPTGRLTEVTGDTLVVPSARGVHAGYYSVQVTNHAGIASTPSVFINVEIGPEILGPPVAVTVEEGDALVVRVGAVGGIPLSYAWWKDGVPVLSATPNREIFQVLSARREDEGRYWVVVTNAFGSVTSAAAQVTVLPAGPNPVYGGRRYTPWVQSGVEAPGDGTPFSAGGFYEATARWWLDQLLFTPVGPAFESLGLFGSGPGGVTRVLERHAMLPNGLGTLDGVRLIGALGSGDAPMFFGNSNGVPVGIFRVDNGQATSLVDVTFDVPGAPGEMFQPFYSFAAQAGGRVAFLGSTAARRGAYVAGDGPLRRLLDTTMDLPVLGATASQVQSIGFDGETAAVLVTGAAPSEQVVLRIDADGSISAVAKVGDPVPGTDKTIRGFGAVHVADGVIRFFALDSGMVRHVMGWREGVLEWVAGPGGDVAGGGTVVSIESSAIHAVAGRVYLMGRVRFPTSTVNGVFAATTAGLEPVFMATKLDGRKINYPALVEVRDQQVVLAVRFEDGGAAYYVNTAELGEPSPRLEYVRVPGVGVRVTVPEGFGLESTDALGGAWEAMPGSGSLEVPTSVGGRFLRLRQVNNP